MATATTSVMKALDTQEDLKDHREHCAPAARVLASLDSGLRRQVRIHRKSRARRVIEGVLARVWEETQSIVDRLRRIDARRHVASWSGGFRISGRERM